MKIGVLAFASLLTLAAAGRHGVRHRRDYTETDISTPIDETVDVRELKIETIEAIPDAQCPYKSGDGSVLVVNYVGALLDGKVIDNSMKDEDIQQFQIGTGMVLRGWEEGLKDMCIGETRKLTIPSRLGHGTRGGGGGLIPPNHALVYTIVLRELKQSGPSYPNPNFFKSLSQPGSSSALTSSSSSSTEAAAEETVASTSVEEPEVTPAPSPKDEL
ncbi:FKBP-type peptidyl-prolyl cis-trans isomerase [Orbilia brochopaga]|uniref:peptidylprolyl isomerase n=1 Tax=Orbilia brochopaga TaxID=3140254 RepID=A0AAV9UF38_9PEZI